MSRSTLVLVLAVALAAAGSAQARYMAVPHHMTPARAVTFWTKARNHYSYVCHSSNVRRVARSHCRAYAWARRELARARAREAPPWPAHHRLWLCIHGGEAVWHDRDSGGNGHYGGLQMHPGWGYGTAYYASDSSQLVQEWAAEKAYRSSGFSAAWLGGQWGQTIGPCWGFA